MQSSDVPVTAATSSSGNIVPPTTAGASATAPPPISTAPQDENLARGDRRIVAGLGRLNVLLRDLSRQAEADDTSETRKAQLQSWIESHEDEIDDRILRLARFAGMGTDPAQSSELRELLRPMSVPAELLAEVQPVAPEASSSKRKRDDSPGPDSPGPATGKGKGKAAARDTAGEGQVEAETGNKKAKTTQTGAQDDEDEGEDRGDDEEDRGDEAEDRGDEGEARKKTNKSVCGAVAYDAVKKQYAELRCTVCGTNTSKDGSFLKGVRGFQTHYRHIHNETLTPQEIFTRFQVRTFTEDEAKKINMAGGPTVNKHEPTAEDDDEQAGPSGGAGGENDDEDEE